MKKIAISIALTGACGLFGSTAVAQTPTQAAAPTPAREARPGEPITLNFVNAEIDAVIHHNRYSLLNRSAEPLIEAAVARGMAVLNAAPYGSGMLVITAEKATNPGPCWNGKPCDYTSARIHSNGKVSFTYGKVEALHHAHLAGQLDEVADLVGA